MRHIRFQRPIIYFIIICLLITAGGFGLEKKSPDYLGCNNSFHNFISEQRFSCRDELHLFAPGSQVRNLSLINEIKSDNAKQINFQNLLLMILIVSFVQLFGYYHLFYIRREKYIFSNGLRLLSFIHDKDGRKRDNNSR